MPLTIPEYDGCLKRWAKSIPRSFRLAFQVSFLFGLIAHMYMMTNKFPNHDEIQNLFTANSTIWFGRWFLGPLSAISSRFSLPWINGLLSILGISVASGVAVTALDIKKPAEICLLAALFVCFPVVGNTFAYMYTADGYFLGLAIGALGVLLLEKYRLGAIGAIPLFILSMASYQSNICFVAALLALRFLQIVLSGTLPDGKMWKKLGVYLCTLAISAFVYVMISKLVVAVAGIALDDARGLSSMGEISLATLPGRILNAYRAFFDFLFADTRAYSTLALSALHGCMLLADGLLMLLLLVCKKRTPAQSILAVLAFLLLPAIFMSIYLFSDTNVHILMIYSMSLFYALLPMLLDQLRALPIEGRLVKLRALLTPAMGWCTVFALAFSTVCWTVYTNQGYLSMQLKYENAYAMTLRVVDRIEQSPDYTPGMTVVIAGYYHGGHYPPSKQKELDDIGEAAGFRSEFEYNFIYNDEHFKDFVRNYIGVIFPPIPKTRVHEIEADPRVEQMPCYPYDGCIQLLDGMLIVKVGEGQS